MTINLSDYLKNGGEKNEKNKKIVIHFFGIVYSFDGNARYASECSGSHKDHDTKGVAFCKEEKWMV